MFECSQFRRDGNFHRLESARLSAGSIEVFGLQDKLAALVLPPQASASG
jgi:hypothetical protein